MLERKTFGLRDEEIGECEGDAAEAAPHEEDFGAEVGVVLGGADEVGGYDANDLMGVSIFMDGVDMRGGEGEGGCGKGGLRSSRTSWKK